MIAERLTAQMLSGTPGRTPEEVVERLLAVQAQDGRGARLSVRSRSQGLRAADVDAALTDRRSLVISWLNRGTLHLVAAEDYWWLHPLTTPQLATANRRRLGQEGVSDAQAARGVEVIADAVGAHGAQTRAQLRQHMDAAGVPTAGQALVHVLVAASLQARVLRGPMIGTQQGYVGVGEWLGPAPEPMARDDALARLAFRYLRGHGPADATDLAKWAGIPLGESRLGLTAIGDRLVTRPDGLVDLADRPGPAGPEGHQQSPAGPEGHQQGPAGPEGHQQSPAGLPAPRLLGAFDPLLLGWSSRTPFVGGYQVVTTNGLFRPFALVDGRVVATWGLNAGVLTVRLLEPVSPVTVQALRADGTAVLRFLDLPADSPIVVLPPSEA